MSWQYWVLAGAVGAGSLLVSLVGISIVLVCLPATFFLDSHSRRVWIDQHGLIRWTGHILKNVAGFMLILVGILLSVPGVPGQGVLTILVGVMLLDFPGKRRLERAIVAQPRVQSAITRLRAHYGKPPFELDEPG